MTAKQKLMNKLFLIGIANGVFGGLLGYFTPEVILGLAFAAFAAVLFALGLALSFKRSAE